MTAALGWVIFIAGLLGASAVLTLPTLFVLKRMFPRLQPRLFTAAAAVASGAVALWFIIPAAIHAAFGGG